MATDLSGARPAVPHEVDRDVLQLLAPCAADLLPQHANLVLAVHARLAELVPELQRLPGAGRPTAQRMVTAMLYAAEPGQSPAHVAAVVQQVGADNYLEGFGTEQYGAVTHALLHAVRGTFRGDWSSALSSAWVEYLMWIRGHLVSGAEAQRAHEAATAAAQGREVRRAPGAGDSYYNPFAERPVQQQQPPPPPVAAVEAAPDGPALVIDDLDDDEDDPAYGSLMTSMTLGGKRERRR
jgi:hemoglobin-like flavoprotein